MKFQLTIFPAGCGDAICISYKGNSGTDRRIMIDSGYMYTYYHVILPWLSDLPSNAQIDLWILTHLDADHINGAYAMVTDKGGALPKGLIHRLWFNFFGEMFLPSESEKVGYKKAINLRDNLHQMNCQEICSTVTTEMKPQELDGATLTILSPDSVAYEQLRAEWGVEEAAYWEAEEAEDVAGTIYPDDQQKIAALVARNDPKENKKDTTNGSSIAFLLESDEEKILMLGDALPSILITSLKKLLAERELDKLKVDYVKLAHHGSIQNYNRELFDLIDCDSFIICSDGYNRYKLPNKETLAKLIERPDKTKPLTFYANYDSPRYKNMFDTDEAERKDLNFNILVRGEDADNLIIP